jgi:hypothetical protein
VISLALLIAIAGVPQDGAVDLNVPGTFQHGQWQGRCFRDGFLSGMDHELCRGWTAGPVVIRFERTAEDLSFRAEATGCAPLDLHMGKAPAGLAPANYAASLSVVLGLTIKDALKTCGSKLKAPKIDKAALAAVLTETDGLEAGTL